MMKEYTMQTIIEALATALDKEKTMREFYEQKVRELEEMVRELEEKEGQENG